MPKNRPSNFLHVPKNSMGRQKGIFADRFGHFNLRKMIIFTSFWAEGLKYAPNSTQIDLPKTSQKPPKSVQVEPILFGPTPTPPFLTRFGPFWPILGSSDPKIDQICPGPSKKCSTRAYSEKVNSPENYPKTSPHLRPFPAKMGPFRSHFDRKISLFMPCSPIKKKRFSVI